MSEAELAAKYRRILERNREHVKKYIRAHKEQHKAAKKRWYEKNREEVLKKMREYYYKYKVLKGPFLKKAPEK